MSTQHEKSNAQSNRKKDDVDDALETVLQHATDERVRELTREIQQLRIGQEGDE